MIKQTIELFEQLANQPWLGIDELKNVPEQIKKAHIENNAGQIKRLFCNPHKLADKTTVFQV